MNKGVEGLRKKFPIGNFQMRVSPSVLHRFSKVDPFWKAENMAFSAQSYFKFLNKWPHFPTCIYLASKWASRRPFFASSIAVSLPIFKSKPVSESVGKWPSVNKFSWSYDDYLHFQSSKKFSKSEGYLT